MQLDVHARFDPSSGELRRDARCALGRRRREGELAESALSATGDRGRDAVAGRGCDRVQRLTGRSEQPKCSGAGGRQVDEQRVGSGRRADVQIDLDESDRVRTDAVGAVEGDRRRRVVRGRQRNAVCRVVERQHVVRPSVDESLVRGVEAVPSDVARDRPRGRRARRPAVLAVEFEPRHVGDRGDGVGDPVHADRATDSDAVVLMEAVVDGDRAGDDPTVGRATDDLVGDIGDPDDAADVGVGEGRAGHLEPDRVVRRRPVAFRTDSGSSVDGATTTCGVSSAVVEVRVIGGQLRTHASCHRRCRRHCSSSSARRIVPSFVVPLMT